MNSLFGVELPTPVNFAIAFALVLVVIALVLIFSIVLRTVLRRVIVRIAEVMALFLILTSTLAGGLWGMSYAYVFARLQDRSESWPAVLGFAFGALSAFIVSAIAFAVLFIMIDIAENTRKTVSFFERMSPVEPA